MARRTVDFWEGNASVCGGAAELVRSAEEE